MDRVLIKQVNWLGDLVMTLPATRAVRDAFPRASISLLVRQELSGFYDGADWIDEVLPYRLVSGLGSIAGQLRLIRDLRARNFDTAVLFPRSFSSALWIRLAGIPRRIGWSDDARGFLLSESFKRLPDLLRQHQVNDHTELVRRGLAIEADPRRLEVPVASDHVDSMRDWLRERRTRTGRLVALAVAAAYGPAKEWPARSYSALIDRLAADFDTECVLVGSPGESARCRAVADAARAAPLVAAGETSVGELIALLSLCDGFVGNDSGSMHVAAALGVPTVGIFGSTRAWRTGPMGSLARVVQHPLECSPCMSRTCRFGHYDCLRSVTVDDVVAGLNEVWVGTAAKSEP